MDDPVLVMNRHQLTIDGDVLYPKADNDLVY